MAVRVINIKLKNETEKKTNIAVKILTNNKPKRGMDNAIVAVDIAPSIEYKMLRPPLHKHRDMNWVLPVAMEKINITKINKLIIANVKVITKIGMEDTKAKKASIEKIMPNIILITI